MNRDWVDEAVDGIRQWRSRQPCQVNLKALPNKARLTARARAAELMRGGLARHVAEEQAFREQLAALGFDPTTGRPR